MGNVRQKQHDTSKFDLTSLDYEFHWDEGFYNFFGDAELGHCYTYNPKHKYQAGTKGQFYALLGKVMLYVMCDKLV